MASVLVSTSSLVAVPLGSNFPICEMAASMWSPRGLGEKKLPHVWKCSIKESSSDRCGFLPDLLTCQMACAPYSY